MRPLRSTVWIMTFAASACSAAVATDAQVAGKQWVAEVEGIDDAKQRPRLEFARDGRLTGYTGCNRLSGAWRIEDGALRFGALATTKRACLGPAGDAEKRLLAALGERSRVTVERGKLVVQGAGGERIEFVEARSTP